MAASILLTILFYSCLTRTFMADDGVMHGNPPTSGLSLSAAPRAFIITHKPLPPGRVDYFWFTSAGGGRRVYLQVWRPQHKNNQFTLVGQVFYQSTRNGTVQVEVPSTTPILCQSGDLLGFTSLDKDVAVTFTLEPFEDGSKLRAMMIDGVPETGKTYEFLGTFFDKKFAISVHITKGLSRPSSCDNDMGGCEQLCSVLDSVAICRCLPGFRLQIDATSCADIDECAESGSLLCGATSLCINTVGSYTCTTLDVVPPATPRPPASPPRSPPIAPSSQLPATAVPPTTEQALPQSEGTETGRQMVSVFTDPTLLTAYVWLLVLTLICLITLVTVCITLRRRVKFIYGSSNLLHLRNPNNINASLDRLSSAKH